MSAVPIPSAPESSPASPASSAPRSQHRWTRRAAAGLVVIASSLGASLVTASAALAAAPTPAGVQPPGTAGLLTVLDWGAWLVSFVCVAGILLVAGMMALKHRRGEAGESMGALGVVLGACVLGAAAGPIAGALI